MLSKELTQDIANYLTARPWREVNDLLVRIMRETAPAQSVSDIPPNNNRDSLLDG